MLKHKKDICNYCGDPIKKNKEITMNDPDKIRVIVISYHYHRIKSTESTVCSKCLKRPGSGGMSLTLNRFTKTIQSIEMPEPELDQQKIMSKDLATGWEE